MRPDLPLMTPAPVPVAVEQVVQCPQCYLAAVATVAFSDLDRSSIYQSRRRPFSVACPGHELPDALGLTQRDSAFGLKAPTSGT